MRLEKNIKTLVVSTLLFTVPLITFAGGSTNFSDFKGFVEWILVAFVTPLFTFMIGLAVVLLVYGVIKYMTASADEKARQDGRMLMVNGVLAVFIIIAFWGFVAMLRTSFGW